MNHIQKMLSVMVCLLMAAPCSLYSKVETTAQILTRAENGAAILAQDPNNYQAAQDLLLAQKLLPKQAAKINTLIQKSSQSVDQLKKTVERKRGEIIENEFPGLSAEDTRLEQEILEAIEFAHAVGDRYTNVTNLNLEEAREVLVLVAQQIDLLIEKNKKAGTIKDDRARGQSIKKIAETQQKLNAILRNLENHIKNLGSKPAPVEEKPDVKDVVKSVEPKAPLKDTTTDVGSPKGGDITKKPGAPVAGDKPAGNIPEAPKGQDDKAKEIIKKSHNGFKELATEANALLNESKALIPTNGFLGFGKNDPKTDALKKCIQKIENFDAKIVTARQENIQTNADLQRLILTKPLTDNRENEARIQTIELVYKKHKELIDIKAQLQAALGQKAPEEKPAAPAEPSAELKGKIAFAIGELKALEISDITALVQEKDALIKKFEDIKDGEAYNAAQKEKTQLIEKIGKVNNLKNATPFFDKKTALAADAPEYQTFQKYKSDALKIINDSLTGKNYASASEEIKAITTEYTNKKNEIATLKNNIEDLYRKSEALKKLIEAELEKNAFNVTINEDTNKKSIETIEKYLAEFAQHEADVKKYKAEAQTVKNDTFNQVFANIDKNILITDVIELGNKLTALKTDAQTEAAKTFDKTVEDHIKNVEQSLVVLSSHLYKAAGWLSKGENAKDLETLKNGEKTLATHLNAVEKLIHENTTKNTTKKEENSRKLNVLRDKIEALQKRYAQDIADAQAAQAKPATPAQPEAVKPADAPKPADVTKPASDFGYSKYTTIAQFNTESNKLLEEVQKASNKDAKKIELKPQAELLYTTLKGSQLYTNNSFEAKPILNNLNSKFKLGNKKA